MSNSSEILIFTRKRSENKTHKIFVESFFFIQIVKGYVEPFSPMGIYIGI